MYDRETAELIRLTPDIQGFDASRLPELLTEAYIRIAALRLAVRRDDSQGVPEVQDAIAKLRTLAQLLEIYSALATEIEKREAAAFVSATAHQLLLQANEVISGEKQPLGVSAETISPHISAALLFLAAGYLADASEIMMAIPPIRSDSDYAPLLYALRGFCTGNMREVIGQSLPMPNTSEIDVQAEFSLWRRILVAMQLMARKYLDEIISPLPDEVGVKAMLEGIRRDSVEGMELGEDLKGSVLVFSTFSGPYHLATLLLAAERGLAARVLVNVPPPTGSPPDQWSSFLRTRALRRPFLWTNHKRALDEGFLNVGVSAVISFPTGAGKSTLSELKIASTLLAGKQVVYLVPTLALVNQVARNMEYLLPPEETVVPSRVDDQLYTGLEGISEASVSVMTPERCLLLATIAPERFKDIGLIVFDECHSLHMDAKHPSQRSLDAMLCLLRLMDGAPDADVLLMSAMVKNGAELAAWLRDGHGKKTFSFDAAWKPTRQARGSILFRRGEINGLLKQLNEVPPNKNLPQSKMRAVPYALVSLQQTWASDNGDDYRVISFASDRSPLRAERDKFTNRPRLKPDTSGLALDITVQSATRGLKTIVFFHNPSSVPSSVRKAEDRLGTGPLVMNEYEKSLFDAIAKELGGAQYAYVPNAYAGGHHGEMLPYERDLVENAFTRDGGIRILFSTNTLAQGMNLPADQVIIVRTSTYDSDAEEYRAVDTHDLLNAAGRAGRAGHAANGMVLVIPNDVVAFNDETGMVSGIDRLKNEVLSLDDRCLAIQDPIEVLLDMCQLAPQLSNKILDSLLVRLPAGNDERDAPTEIRRFLSRSFAARKAATSGNSEVFDFKVASMIARRSTLIQPETPQSVATVSSSTGLLPQALAFLLERLSTMQSPEEMGPLEWIEWVDEWLDAEPLAHSVLREDIPRLTGNIARCLELWLNGATFEAIELQLGTPIDKLKNLKEARKFSKGIVREVSYLVGLVAQVAATSSLERRTEIERYASLSAVLIREGVDSLDKLILLQHMRNRFWTRVQVHESASEWLSLVEPPTPGESPTDASRRILEGITTYQSLFSA